MYWLLKLILHEIENNSVLLPSLNWISQTLGNFYYFHSLAHDKRRASVLEPRMNFDIYFKASDTPLKL